MKALLLGGYDKVPYHPLTEVDEHLKTILAPTFHITIATKNEVLNSELSGYDLIISYVDIWDNTLTDSETAGLIQFVASGGGLLVIHNGICLAARHEMKGLMGASFTGHPAAEVLSFQLSETNAITEGIEPFSVHEEPYEYAFCNHMNPRVFMNYEYHGEIKPSGWTVKFGLGKVAYVHPGHEVSVFKCDSYRQILSRCALWCVNELALRD